ncbi:MAG TPA: trehalose-phosphatase [Solimonas sp.]|nr:trehalose-phosphatase [Solimonas sp.]
MNTATANAAPGLALPTPWQKPPTVRTAEIALFHDIDGSLLELAADPDQVIVAAYLPALLAELREALGGALAVVTGRPLSVIDQLLTPLRLAGAGLHGAELRSDPEGPILQGPYLDAGGVAEALRLYFAGDPRILVEDKGMAVALHYRHAPMRRAECEAVVGALASTLGLSVTLGKMVVEALPPAANKGQALQQLLRQPPFAGRMPVFVGDDVTDEDGIAVAQALGGYGVKVGPGPSAARYRLDTVRDVHRWLAAGAALQGTRP